MEAVVKSVAVYLPEGAGNAALRQRVELRNYLSSKGWARVTYFEGRGHYLDLINRVKANEFAAVVVRDLASLARSWKDLISVLKSLIANKIDLVSFKDHIDTTNSTEGLSFPIVAQALIKFQSDLRSIQIREGLAKAKKRGKILGRKSRIPIAEVHRLRYLGYTMENAGLRLGGTKSAISKILAKNPQPPHLPLPFKAKDILPWMPVS